MFLLGDVSLPRVPQPRAEQNQGPLWEHPELAGLDVLRHRHSLTALCVPRRFVGLARRRMGRGGR